MGSRTVFLSSTGRDLHAYRDAVYRAIEGLDGYHCVRMEEFGARDWESDTFCRNQVRNAGLFVGLIGHLWGSAPRGSDQSYTEREYDAACAASIPRLMFLADPKFPIPADIVEESEKRRRQRAFRERVSRERVRGSFSSPEELARLVIQAIRNWEAPFETRRSRSDALYLGPLPPLPNIVHPYPIQAHFTGRRVERESLTGWWHNQETPVCVVAAIGGMGKSAVTWVWTMVDLLGEPLSTGDLGPTSQTKVARTEIPHGMIWWSFYEQDASFARFTDHAILYLSGGKLKPQDFESAHDKIRAILQHLSRGRFLLVLDGIERELRAYAGLASAYQGDKVEEDVYGEFRSCADPHLAEFLRWAASSNVRGKILITTRLVPRELDALPGATIMSLDSLSRDDAVSFMHSEGISGSRQEIEQACEPYGFHPLALRLLSGLVKTDPVKPNDIRAAPHYDPTPNLVARKHHILKQAYDALSDAHRVLLSNLAAFRSPITFAAASAVSPFQSSDLKTKRAQKNGSETQLRLGLQDLVIRGFLFFEPSSSTYDMHPVIRSYAYDRLADKTGVHLNLQSYFSAVPVPASVGKIEDLTPVVELFHHTVTGGSVRKAFDLYWDRLNKPLYYRFGDYHTCVQLLDSLRRANEDSNTRLRDDQEVRVMNALACGLAQDGDVAASIELFDKTAEFLSRYYADEQLSVVLSNRATQEILTGRYDDAEETLRRAIILAHTVASAVDEGIAHRELGLTLALRGEFGDANHSFQQADSLLKGRQSKALLGMNEAISYMLQGHVERAQVLATKAHELAASRKAHRDYFQSLWLLGVVIGVRDEPRAAQLLRESLHGARKIGHMYLEAEALLGLARVEPSEATNYLAEAKIIGNRCGYEFITPRLLP